MAEHLHEFRVEERTARTPHSVVERLVDVSTEVRIRRTGDALPPVQRLAEGIFLSNIGRLTDPRGRVFATDLEVSVTLTQEEIDVYLALRERIMGRVLAALEAAKQAG